MSTQRILFSTRRAYSTTIDDVLKLATTDWTTAMNVIKNDVPDWAAVKLSSHAMSLKGSKGARKILDEHLSEFGRRQARQMKLSEEQVTAAINRVLQARGRSAAINYFKLLRDSKFIVNKDTYLELLVKNAIKTCLTIMFSMDGPQKAPGMMKNNRNRRRNVKSPTPLPKRFLYSEKTTSMLYRVMHKLRRGGEYSIPVEEVVEICIRSREMFLQESNMISIDELPLFIMGDIHGQLSDLLSMLTIVGFPPKHVFLFLGDYVDRGSQSLEVITLLFIFKLLYPRAVHLLRGNHETRCVNIQYGFYDECIRKYPQRGIEIWTHFQHVFNCLPIAALVAKRMFCAHGGISEELHSFNQLDRIVRPTDICDIGLLCDLVWSDPSPNAIKFGPSPRGISQIFGKQAVVDFCTNLCVDVICRAHQCVIDGENWNTALEELATMLESQKYKSLTSSVYWILEAARRSDDLTSAAEAVAMYVKPSILIKLLTFLRLEKEEVTTAEKTLSQADARFYSDLAGKLRKKRLAPPYFVDSVFWHKAKIMADVLETLAGVVNDEKVRMILYDQIVKIYGKLGALEELRRVSSKVGDNEKLQAQIRHFFKCYNVKI